MRQTVVPEAVLAALTAAHQGDADAVDGAFTADAVMDDDGLVLQGIDEIRNHFLAFGGRREKFEITDVQTGHIHWRLHYRADASAFVQEGTARVVISDGLIAQWDSAWEERETGLDAWGGD